MYSIYIVKQGGKFSEASLSLLNDKTADVRFQVNEESIHAHRAFLSKRSTYFEKLLGNGCIETYTDNIHIEGCDFATFKALLIYFYSNRIVLQEDVLASAVKLYILADKYEVSDLLIMLEQTIKDSLTSTTVLDYLFSDAGKIDILQKLFLEFISNHFISVFLNEKQLEDVIEKYKTHDNLSTLFAKIWFLR